MSFKNILITIILIIIVVLVGWWLVTKYKPPVIEDKDEITTLLTELKGETGIDFSDIKDFEFIWQTKDGEIPVQGRGFEASRISDEEFRSIGTFFTNKEFESDVYNIAAGTISGMVGYKLSSGENQKESIVCHFIAGVTGYKEATGEPASPDASQGGWIPPEPELKDVEIKCGKAEIPEEPVIVEDIIKKVFAEKYDKKVSAVSLNITEETGNYARGGVTFLDEGFLGIGGLFLATKINGEWMLVFDGNGSFSCDMLRDYDFPEDMMEGCAEDMEPMLNIKNGSDFYITLKSNPTTGYQWSVDFDSDFLELVDNKYIPDSDDPMLVGGGGKDYFRFKALKSGITEIKFFYARPWESVQPMEEKNYRIGID